MKGRCSAQTYRGSEQSMVLCAFPRLSVAGVGSAALIAESGKSSKVGPTCPPSSPFGSALEPFQQSVCVWYTNPEVMW